MTQETSVQPVTNTGSARRRRWLRRVALARRGAGRPAPAAGFTLLEVMVVLVILGIVAAIFAGPQVFQLLGGAKTEAAQIQIEKVGTALDFFRLQVGRYPSEEEGLQALVERPAGVSGWSGPYLKSVEQITDPWGRMFLYRQPGQNAEYDLFSRGADNADGGEGEDQDVTSWQK